MKFVTHIDEKKFTLFNENHPNGHALQSIEWGNLKCIGEWTKELVGLEDGSGDLQASAMLLRRKLPGLSRYILYAPRGYVLDYENIDLVKEFTKELKQYAKKTKAIFVKIDPCIIYKERTIDGDIKEDGIDNTKLIESLKNMGYAHKGTNLDFEGIQPRFVFKLDVDKDKDTLFKSFHHKTRYNIRLAEKKGIEIYEGSIDDLEEFERIMRVTGSRDGFITRPLKYFKDMYNTMEKQGKMKLFMAKYNVKKALDKAISDLEKEENSKKPNEDRINKLQREIPEMTELASKNLDGIIVSGAIVLLNGKKAWYLYGASDNLYRNLMPNYLLQWHMIAYSMDCGCTLYDFRGISGNLDPNHHLYGLYRFKKGFNGDFVEYIGEFDLVVSKFYYNLWEFWVPKVKRLIRKLRKK
ncbi:lipid II:glycine glycyltransferase FemX [Vallitalea guaymasensis]|uniref:Peptidoglycan bridge formation glycyltransferase FemA/FemB family protein n=1 Tax=Vallitalea guaymasensis TaxID=1185412 RepID=A0A8J8MF20_9FIRM|nr:peptidoglycan bridge formation glycyltransferase FemA/FemB family protein [Vallitalea guaymasensis]QUH31430.1 peptidoglycan bridge formation glycyltransferase FemA/FemB family protein [Vallitalea guaymasensis]